MPDSHIKAQIAFYSAQAAQTNAHWQRIHRKRMRFLAQSGRLDDAASILEIGCHAGEFLSLLSGPGRRLVGIDLCPALISAARQRFGIEAYCADVMRGLPFADAEFSLVVMTEVIEHVIDTDYLLAEANRVLKPGGSLFLTTPNLCSLKNRVRVLLGRYPDGPEFRCGGAGHVRVYTAPVLAAQLVDHGFTIQLYRGFNFLPDALTRRAPWMDRLDDLPATQLPNACSNTCILAVKAAEDEPSAAEGGVPCR